MTAAGLVCRPEAIGEIGLLAYGGLLGYGLLNELDGRGCGGATGVTGGAAGEDLGGAAGEDLGGATSGGAPSGEARLVPQLGQMVAPGSWRVPHMLQ